MVAQSSKKMGCKAKIIIKSVLEFPEYKVSKIFISDLWLIGYSDLYIFQ